LEEKVKFTLFIMNEKGYSVLKSFFDLFGKDHIDKVISSEDPGQVSFFTDIKTFCEQKQITFFDRKDLKQAKWEYAIAIGWKWLLPTTKNLIVLHDSLLPKYRGFNPLVSQLLNKDNKIGVTSLWASEEADKGYIISSDFVTITYPIKIQEAIELIIPLYVSLVNDIVKNIISNKIPIGCEQNEKEATYSLWRDEEDYEIPWDSSSEYIKRLIDASGFPYSGAYSFLNFNKVRILEAKEIPDEVIINRTPGKIFKYINGFPVVVCGQGLILLEKIVDEQNSSIILNKMRLRFK